MGKISVSLPDELEAELDDYARRHELPVSRVVATALEKFFGGSGPEPPPAPPPRDASDDLARLQLLLVQNQAEAMRGVLWEALGYLWGPGNRLQRQLPGPLPPPPWTPFLPVAELPNIPPLPDSDAPVGEPVGKRPRRGSTTRDKE